VEFGIFVRENKIVDADQKPALSVLISMRRPAEIHAEDTWDEIRTQSTALRCRWSRLSRLVTVGRHRPGSTEGAIRLLMERWTGLLAPLAAGHASIDALAGRQRCLRPSRVMRIKSNWPSPRSNPYDINVQRE